MKSGLKYSCLRGARCVSHSSLMLSFRRVQASIDVEGAFRPRYVPVVKLALVNLAVRTRIA